MLVAHRNGMAVLGKPYDAEVEYLESSDTDIQWIDTGLVPAYTWTIEGKYQRQGASGYNAGDYNVLFGGNFDGDAEHSCYGVYSHGPWLTKFDFDNKLYAGVLFQWDEGNPGVYDKSEQTLSMDASAVSINGVSKPPSARDGTSVIRSSETFKLFNVLTTKANWTRIWYCKIVDGSNIVRDMIPVRFTNEQGVSEGAMYDRVSGQLFRIVGTGAFTIGPDKS